MRQKVRSQRHSVSSTVRGAPGGAALAASGWLRGVMSRNSSRRRGTQVSPGTSPSGLGGRNQELALSAAAGIAGLEDTAVFSLGSDGTDGPTDAAGGFVDGGTKERLARQGVRIFEVLKNNDAYHALAACGGLLHTGATGTNVNDVAVLLIRR